MFCSNCNSEMEKTVGQYHFIESGLDNVWLDEWEIYVCPQCNIQMPLLPDPEVFTKELVKALVRLETRLDGDLILFLRKAMGLKAIELAHVLGVHRVEVSRWENDRAAISPHHDFKLRMEAIDRVLPLSIRRELRAEVALVIQRPYRSDVVAEEPIHVPKTAFAAA